MTDHQLAGTGLKGTPGCLEGCGMMTLGGIVCHFLDIGSLMIE